MTTVIDLNKDSVKKFTDVFEKPLQQTDVFFKLLGAKVHQKTMLTFRHQGERDDHKKWLNYNWGKGHILGGSTRMKSGTWRIRYGTDMKGRPGMQGIPRKTQRRYSETSKLLQASGEFMRSFRVTETDKKHMRYETNHEKASLIMRRREVLFVTKNDLIEIRKMFLSFYKAGLLT